MTIHSIVWGNDQNAWSPASLDLNRNSSSSSSGVMDRVKEIPAHGEGVKGMVERVESGVGMSE